jgi:transposase
VTDGEIVARVERRRKWTLEEKAALMAEVEAEGGKVRPVARRHRIAESLLYNWRAARTAAVVAPEATAFMPLGMIGGSGLGTSSMRPSSPRACVQASADSHSSAGAIEIALPNGSRVRVDAYVDETALVRVLRALQGAA